MTVNTGGTLLLNSASNNIINTAATVSLGGTIKIDDSRSSNTQTFGALTVTAGGTLDFGNGDTNKFVFFSLAGVPANTLTVKGWTGGNYLLGTILDNTAATQDRLLFTTDPGGALGALVPGVSFINGGGVLIGKGMKVTNAGTPGSPFEFVSVADQVAFWHGGIDANWNSGTATNTNWRTDAGAATVATLPGAGTDVFFTTDTAGVANLSTTLGQDFTINSLTYRGAGTGAANSTAIAGNNLTVNANAGFYAAGFGIVVGAGNTVAHTISSNVVLGGNQTWTNAGTGLLTVGGASTVTAVAARTSPLSPVRAGAM